MEEVYLLRHVYAVDEEIDEVKFLGIFSNMRIINKAIQLYSTELGFKDYSVTCFKVEKFILNTVMESSKTYITEDDVFFEDNED